MIKDPLKIILDVTFTSPTLRDEEIPQLRKSGEEERGETAKSAY